MNLAKLKSVFLCCCLSWSACSNRLPQSNASNPAAGTQPPLGGMAPGAGTGGVVTTPPATHGTAGTLSATNMVAMMAGASASHASSGGAGSGGVEMATAARGGNGAAGQSTGGAPASAAGSGSPTDGDCGANLLDVPDDLHQRGPWEAAVRTLKAGRVTLELFYPAPPGSGAGHPEATYNHSDWLPAPEKSKTTKGIAPVSTIGGKLYRDLPIDEAHGPYPVVLFIHGTASMRAASISTNAHWASRGFVVAVADYPGLDLTDQLNSACGYPTTGDQDVEGDLQAQIMALSAATGDYAFLKGHVDMSRLALAGHSQGACMSATLSTTANVRVVMPISGSTQVSPAPDMKSIMWIAGMDDTVIGYSDSLLGNVVCPANPLPASSDTGAYDASPGPPDVTKRIAGIRGGGHLSVTDLCQVNSLGHTDLEQMHMDNICGVDSAVIIGLPALFDCGTIDWKMGVDAVNYVSTAALEETLLCRNRKPQFDALQTNVPVIGDYRHAP